MKQRVSVVGAGLAGSECALQLANRGVQVLLYEQRPVHTTPAHHTDYFAELVCSNSLKSDKPDTAAGLLKRELEAMGSELIAIARSCAVDAGGALAVDRDLFGQKVSERVLSHPGIELRRERVSALPEGPCVIAAGPLCSDDLFAQIAKLCGSEHLSFFDAAAPIVDAESIDRSIVFSQSRYEGEGEGDYLNCPMDKEQYEVFVQELVSAKRTIPRDFEENDLFCACQPAEEVARKGLDTLRFGALKPVGITDPKTGRRPWAVVQLRAENAARTAYNLVGFQTNLTWPEQARVFRMIPGLENAEFLRYGVMHRNSFVDAPHCLDTSFAVPGTQLRLAGQISGTEGYTEAIASGLFAALNTYADLEGLERPVLPVSGAFGSLVAYATDPNTKDYQPMHVNFGLVPPIEGSKLKKRARYEAYAKRAMADMDAFVASRPDLFAQEAHHA